MAPSLSMTLLVLVVLALCMANGAYAFGAGEIPDVSAMAKIAYRHGTIENVLENIAKSASSSGPGAGRLIAGVAGALFTGNAGGLANAITSRGGEKFSGLDIKRVYFGNWLRDYSQAMDIAGLSKLSGDSIVLVVMCLGFMAFGYATEEFEVTKEKLGVYLCTEHIDNPKGYSSDAQRYDMRLRPPVKDEELEIDPNNGMKKYIATEGQGFDTSTYCIRMHLRKCIELGRNGGEKERFEAYRELGTALHTLEDFLAHSNYLELALNKLGHRNVFCHVGDNVRVQAPNGQNVPPIVTGTFGGSDFLVSVMGEVGDKLSSSTVNDLNAKFNDAKKQNEQKGNGVEMVKALMSKIGSGGDSNVDSQLENVEEIRKNAVNIDPSKIASKEVQKIFVDVLRTRDSIFKNIEHTLEQLGLDQYIDELTNALSILVLTTLEPYVAPIIKTVTEGLTAGSSAILQQEDQLLVFNDDNASDPTHSVLSKDHFDLWLNEPAGLVAIEVVKHTVPLIVQAWSDHSINADQVIDVILQALHHPYFARGDSQVQGKMLETVRTWLDGMDTYQRNKVINSLSKESVRAGNNKREDAETFGTLGHQCGPGHAHHSSSGGAYGSHQGSHQLATGNRLAGNPAQHHFGGEYDGSSHGASGQGMAIAGGFGSMQQNIGGRMEDRYNRQDRDNQGYSSGRPQVEYAGNTQNTNQYSSNQYDSNQYGSNQYGSNQYGSQQQQFSGGGGRRDDGHNHTHGQRRNEGDYQRRDDDDDDRRSGRHAQPSNEDAYGGRSEHTGFQGGRPEYGSSAFDEGRRDDHNTYGQRSDERRGNPYGGYNDNNDRPGQRFGGGHDDDTQGGFHGGNYQREDHEERSRYGQGYHRENHEESSQYGQGRHESDYKRVEEHHAESRYGGEDMGSRFGAMNLGGGERSGRDDNNNSYGRRRDEDEPSYGGRRDEDDEPSHGRGGYGGRHDNEEEHSHRRGRNSDSGNEGGSYGQGRRGYGYGGNDGSSQKIKVKDKKGSKSDSSDDDKKQRKYKKESSPDSDDEIRYKKKQDSGDSDEEKRYKKELKKAEKKGKKERKDHDSSDDDSDSDDKKKQKKYGKKY